MSESCSECMACCHDIVIRVTRTDVQREPRLIGFAQPDPGKGTYRLCPREIGGGQFNYTCPFLRGWGCAIYETRPTVCVRFTRGSQECGQARKRARKEPISVEHPLPIPTE